MAAFQYAINRCCRASQPALRIGRLLQSLNNMIGKAFRAESVKTSIQGGPYRRHAIPLQRVHRSTTPATLFAADAIHKARRPSLPVQRELRQQWQSRAPMCSPRLYLLFRSFKVASMANGAIGPAVMVKSLELSLDYKKDLQV